MAKFNIKTLFLLLCSSLILVAFLPSLIKFASMLDHKYEGYQTLTSGGGGGYLTLAYVLMSVFFVYARKDVESQKRDVYDSLLLMFIMGTIVYCVVILGNLYNEISRFACYFHVSGIFIWPILLKYSRFKYSFFVKSAFVVGHLLFMYIFYSRMAGLVPYLFNSII